MVKYKLSLQQNYKLNLIVFRPLMSNWPWSLFPYLFVPHTLSYWWMG